MQERAAITGHWLDELELRDVIEEIAGDLFAFPRFRRMEEKISEVVRRIWEYDLKIIKFSK